MIECNIMFSLYLTTVVVSPNAGETLSTLLFATRCMAVKTVPVQHAEVDYAEMCAALQAKLNEMEGLTTQVGLQCIVSPCYSLS